MDVTEKRRNQKDNIGGDVQNLMESFSIKWKTETKPGGS
jgi:hypothetical protein